MKACINHSHSPSEYHCIGCKEHYCADCVQKLTVGDFQTTVCPDCGAQCIPVALSEGHLTQEQIQKSDFYANKTPDPFSVHEAKKKAAQETQVEKTPAPDEAKAPTSEATESQSKRKNVLLEADENNDDMMSTHDINLAQLAFNAKASDAPMVSPLPPPATVTYKMFTAPFKPSRVFSDLAAREHPCSRLIFWSIFLFAGAILMTWIGQLALPLPLPLTHAIGLLATYGLIVPLYFALVCRLSGRRKQSVTWFFMFLGIHLMFIFGTRILMLPAYLQSSLILASIPFLVMLVWETAVLQRALTKGLDFNSKESILLILPFWLGVPLVLTLTYHYLHGIG